VDGNRHPLFRSKGTTPVFVVYRDKGDNMQKLYFAFQMLVLASLSVGCVGNAIAQSQKVIPTATTEVISKIPPADCPVTTAKGSLSFEAPAPYSPSAPWDGIFWFGSNHLWTALNANGVWSNLPLNPGGYTQKIMWWSDLYSLKDELEPELVVTGEWLDAKAPLVKVSRATNAYASDIGDAMLVGVDFPTLGCWQITGQYKGTELSFVVWIAP
jgi:hypothetical protein